MTNVQNAKGEPDGVVPDLGPLESSLGYRLRRVQLRVFEDFGRTFAEIGLRPTQFSVLVVIARNPGLRQSEVAHALGIQRTNFVPLVDSLESRGLLERRLSQQDRRSYALHLTEEGSALLTRALAAHQAHEERLAALLGPELRSRLLADLPKLDELLRREAGAANR